jgi:hypothetical protein
MVSILCDGPFFDGSWEHVSAARGALDAARRPVPVLAKEYVLDARQIEEARDRGADAVLLIARIVSPTALRELAAAARAEGLEPLLEVVDEAELHAALDTGGTGLRASSRRSRPGSSPFICRAFATRRARPWWREAARTPCSWARRSCAKRTRGRFCGRWSSRRKTRPVRRHDASLLRWIWRGGSTHT